MLGCSLSQPLEYVFSTWIVFSEEMILGVKVYVLEAVATQDLNTT